MKKLLSILVASLVMPLAAAWGGEPINQSDAKWIGCESNLDLLEKRTIAPARYLRKTVKLKGKVEQATMYVCGLGLYDAWINGKMISKDQVLSPTVSDYRKRVYYNTFDVTGAMKKKTAICIVLGNGRYFSMRNPGVTNFGVPRLWLKIDITYKNGETESIISDESWKISVDGPIRANNEFDGEVYDARKEFGKWTKYRFKDAAWSNASIMQAPGGELQAQPNPNMAIQDRLTPVSIKNLGDTSYVLDMGQNMVGWLQVRAKKIAEGDTLRLRFSETLNEDGSLYVANLRSAKATDQYVSKGKGRFAWHPEFIYHGFRYVEVTGLAKAPKLSDFEGQVFYDKMDLSGHFECSDPVINRVYQNAYWGIRGNYRGMPTDCPQRDERMGWFGDRATGCYGESYIFNNHALYSKWLTDIEDSQLENGHLPDVAPRYWNVDSDNMTWCGVFITAADMIRWRFGDEQPIKDHYDAMKKWLSFMRDKYVDKGIMTKDRYGDWCMPPESLELIHSKDPSRITAGPVISTAFYYYFLCKMQEFARIAGHPEDAMTFKAQAEETLDAFNKAYLKKDQGCYDNNTVTANLMPLYFGMVPEEYRQDVFNNLVRKTEVDCDGHVSCGVIGIMFLMRTLTDFGREDLALKIAANDTYPSWGYMAKNGATTIWELWNGNTAAPDMNSGNHVMLLGDLVIWEYEYLAGIRPLEPGYASIELKPYPIKGLEYVNCSYDSVRGKIVSNWTLKNGKFEWDVEIPEGTTAKAYLPTKNGIRSAQNLTSGRHHLSTEL